MRRPSRFVLPVIVVGACFAAASPSASAATFCVSDPACVTAGGTAKTTLQSAFDATDANGTGIDQVEVGATTLAAGGEANNPVNLIGEGQAQTHIGGAGSVVELLGSGSSVRDLTVTIDGTDIEGLGVVGTARRVTVSGFSNVTNANGFRILGPGVSDHLTATFSSGFVNGMTLVNGAVLEDSTANAGRAVLMAGPSTVRRMVATGGIVAGTFGPGDYLVEDSVVTAKDGIFLTSPLIGPGGNSMTVRNVTVVNPSLGTPSAGLGVSAECTPAGSANMTVRSTIVVGVENQLQRSGDIDCASGSTAAASMDIADSLFDPRHIQQSGTGTLTQNVGNVTGDPRFADPAAKNYALTFGSPAIDAGDPAALVPGESATDVLGAARISDGDTDGVAVRDMGALEAPPGTSAPRFSRSLKLSYSPKSGKFKGKLGSPAKSCLVAKVNVVEKHKSHDPKIGFDKSSSKGKWTVEADVEPGSYYATVRPSESKDALCPGVTTKPVRVR